ncbi:MAG TPA: hypothetical protein VFA03_07225 [Acetobacteraceae bacterium]|nr:hypothetical protein [Acetobacteraceae bacterium]
MGSVICGVDVVLRRWYGVREFTSDPGCLFRLARAPAPHEVRLSDGTVIAPGEEVLILHIWNEQVPRFRFPSGPDLMWALDVRSRLLRSFRLLARHLAEESDTQHIRAIHGCVAFGSRRRRWQLRRAAARFGFDLIDDAERPKGLHERGEDVLIWVFTRAFNPAALRRQPLWRDRTELWISRAELLRRYL